MLIASRRLPRGVAVIRVRTYAGPVVLVSDRCPKSLRRAARLVAAYGMATGSDGVLVRERDLRTALRDP